MSVRRNNKIFPAKKCSTQLKKFSLQNAENSQLIVVSTIL